MAFQDDFVAFLATSGVTLDVAVAPSRDVLTEGLKKIDDFMGSLDVVTQEALNDVTAEFPIKAIFADPTVDIAPELNAVFKAFDASGTSFSISIMAQLCAEPLGVPDPPSAPGAPTIDSIVSHQPVLHNDQGNIVVGWSVPGQSDKYHFMWTFVFPLTPALDADLSNWNEVELNTPPSLTFTIPDTTAGFTYTFKVQACLGEVIGSDLCSPFSAERSLKIPENTRSLRTFLALSGVPANSSVRALGNFPSLRAMMRI